MDANLFTEGSIYFYENITNHKSDYDDDDLNHDFLVSRPVYILNSNPPGFKTYTINVLAITSSSHRVGIPINITGYRNGKILPYAIYSVHDEYLTKYMGQVDDDMKAEVRNAVAYHLGMSSNVPEYIKNYKIMKYFKEEMLENLTDQERTVYNLIKTKCIFRENYFIPLQALFKSYRREYPTGGYTRISDFTKAIEKFEDIFSNIRIRTNKEGVKEIRGLTLESYNYKKDIPDCDKYSRDIINNNSMASKIATMPKDQLLGSLSSSHRNTYKNLDNIDKFENLKRQPKDFTFHVRDQRSSLIIKRLIEIDMSIFKEKLCNQLTNGMSPYKLKQDQIFVLCHFSNSEIQKYVNGKYLRNGVNAFRRNLKNEVRYLFKATKT